MRDIAREIRNIWTIASKEFMDNIGSKRFIILAIFYFGLELLLTAAAIMIIGRQPATSKASLVIEILNNVNIILAILAVIVSADTLSLERKDRTIYQLLSKPIERSSVVIGKFLGCLGVVATLFLSSALVAYALTAIIAHSYPSAGDIGLVIVSLLSMLVLLAVYVAIGVFVSSITKNPFISIIGSFLALIGLWFSSNIGNIIGYNVASGGASLLIGDAFQQYPIYAQVMIWIDPLSHGVMSQILQGGGDPAAGMPVWANVVFLLVYTGVLMVLSVMLFDYRDISG